MSCFAKKLTELVFPANTLTRSSSSSRLDIIQKNLDDMQLFSTYFMVIMSV
ncbi:MAG TPA: hypothetical protein VIP70_11525 [Nitrososphaeraceae archaeon]